MKSGTRRDFPAQAQEKPGKEYLMRPRPLAAGLWYKGSEKLLGKVAIITGGDSGIGRSVAVFFAREGADISIIYYNEHKDAQDTKEMVEKEGRKCLLISGDAGSSSFCTQAVKRTVEEFKKLDILVNNSAFQNPNERLEDISDEEIETTFRTNIFSQFYMTRAALAYLKEGSVIINTTSVTAYEGHPVLLDYASTKGAIVSFTRALALNLVGRGIRVNAVAPGPIWTPFTVSAFSGEKVATFGTERPMGRAGQPEEVAPAYVFLASRDSSYISGQVLHPNGGTIVNG